MKECRSVGVIALTLLILFSPLPISAQLSRYSQKFTVSKKNFVDSIEVSFENGQVLVPVVIQQKQYRFLLDTGAGQAVVFADCPIPNCEPAGQIISHDAVGHSDTVRMVKLPPMHIGTVGFSGCQATIQQRVVSNPDIDGIIGFDLVCKGLQMKIDVAHHLLILTDRKKFFDKEQGFEAKYKLNFHVPYIEVSPFKGYKELVLFDTGSRHLFLMNKQHFDEAEKENPMEVTGQVEGRSEGRHAMGHQGAERLGEVVFLYLKNFSLGGCVLTDLRALTTQGGSHLGAQLLQYGAVVFNPKRNRLKFQPYEEGKTLSIGNDYEPLIFVIDQGRTVVGLVWEHGPAYDAGFRVGDVVLRKYVDGTYVLRDVQGQEKEIKWKK